MVSGAGLERYVCFQADNFNSFMVMQHFADVHQQYNKLLLDVEKRWYGVKKANVNVTA